MATSNDILVMIASQDDLIQLCGLDIKLAEKYQKIYSAKESLKHDFDPIISMASNKELLESNYDLWTDPKGKSVSKGVGKFDTVKYTKFYITSRALYLESKESEKEYKKDGFDCYSYLMAYEEDILTKYEDEKYAHLTKLQKAALHYIEVTNDVVPLDYLKYVASFDDLTLMCLVGKPEIVSPEEYIINFGKMHYENTGFKEIHSQQREVGEFFDPWKYIASYPVTKDAFWNAEDDTLNETLATLGYLTGGAASGLVRNLFQANVYLANYPDHVKDDIYVNKKVSEHKVAKVWLQNFPNEVKLDNFDVFGFAENKGLEQQIEGFKVFVSEKVDDYAKLMKEQKKLWYKVKNMVLCSSLQKPLPKPKSGFCPKFCMAKPPTEDEIVKPSQIELSEAKVEEKEEIVKK